MMNRVKIDLENCYGIKKLQYDFDFTEGPVYAIYAPNGVMKSSLMNTFRAISEGRNPEDRIFKARVAKATILDEAGIQLKPEGILTVRNYDEDFRAGEETAKILVNEALRKELQALLAGINKAREALFKAISKQANSKRDFEHEISALLTADNDLETALTRIQPELSKQEGAPLAYVLYDKVFDEKILQFLEKNADAKTALDDYVRRLNELLAASQFFRKGTFDYYNAAMIAEALTKHGFFDANHTITLNSGKGNKQVPISHQEQLEAVIEAEKNVIFNDPSLQKKFNKFSSLLWKNETLRDFQAYLLEHDDLVPRLQNIRKFKEDVLKSYIKANIELYKELLAQYESAAKRKKDITAEALKESTQWEQAVQIFKERFVVPFELEIQNKPAAVLGNAAPTLAFTYHDGNDKTSIAEADLMVALSTGERKAFYILNIIFVVEARRKEKRETLIVVDDLADSFDYQNKYAIIEYLNDQKESGLFKHIVMTHNFDFFRTINLRFVGNYTHCLMARKEDAGIVLEQGRGIRDVFLNDLRDNFYSDAKKRIACIPFMRNVIEMMNDATHPTYMKLTSLLHWKPDTMSITEADLDGFYNSLFNKQGNSPNGARPVVELIHKEAGECMNAAAGVNFENKIVLAVAARLAAEKYIVNKLNDPHIYDDMPFTQTHELLQKYKKYAGNNGDIAVLSKVALMTPENIHLNSFMYEPIIDMSDDALRNLYKSVCSLK
jgi:hypothetical protein